MFYVPKSAMHVKVILLVCTIVTAVSSRRMKKDPCHGLPDDTFIANSKGCKYFFCCKNGIGVSAYCPHGLWFNAKNSVCDLPHEVDCHLDDPVTTTTTTTTVKPTQEPGSTIETTTSSATTTTTQLPIIDADQDEIVCPPHDANTVQFVGSKINCRHFYICYHGRAVRQECGEGLHWSAKTKQCAAVADAGCKIIPKPAMRFPKCPNNGNHFYPHPTECDYYIHCRYGFYSIQQCPFYHHWDVTTESCRWRRFTHCAATAGAGIATKRQRHRQPPFGVK